MSKKKQPRFRQDCFTQFISLNQYKLLTEYGTVGDTSANDLLKFHYKNHQISRRPETTVSTYAGTKHSVHLDLTQPQWWVTDNRKPGSDPMPLQKLTEGWAASFRIEYAPPTADAVKGLPHSDLIRHAPLRSRAFNPNQGVD